LEIKVVAGDITQIEADAIVVNLFEGEQLSGAIAAVDKALDGAITHLISSGGIKSKFREVSIIHTLGKLPARIVAVAGLGKRQDFTPDKVREVAGESCRSLRKLNCRKIATMLHGAGDGGIDGYGNLEMGVVRVRAAFQVKRWRQNVPRPEIDRFRGAIAGSFDQGIFITTSDFSDEAKQVSTKSGTVPIVLIDGNKIVDIMLEKGLGVRREPLTITTIDEDFFMAFGISGEE